MDELPDFGEPVKKKIPTDLLSASKTTKPSSVSGQQAIPGLSASPVAASTKKQEATPPVRQSEGTLLRPTKTKEGLDVPGRFDVWKKGWKNLDTDISTNVNRQRELQNTRLKDLTYSANKLEYDKNKFQQKINQFEADYKANKNDPSLLERQKQLQKEQDQLNARLDSFKFQKNAVEKGDEVISQTIRDKNATIGELESVWNQLKSAGAKTIAAFDAIPAYAANLALDLELAANGKTDEFNKLPAAAKKEVRNMVLGNTSPGYQGSQQAYDYWNQLSEKVLEKTIEQEGDIFDDTAKFVSDPSVENAGNLLRRGVSGFAQAVPYMAQGMLPGGLVTLGVTSAAAKRMEDIDQDGNAGIGYALTSGIHGAAEGFFEAKTNEILKRAGAKIIGNKDAAENLTKSLFNEIAKDFNEEGLSEGLTTLFQETADKVIKGEPVDLVKLARKIGESYLIGGAIGGGITGGAGITSKAFNKVKESIAGKNLLTGALITAEDKKRLDEIRNTTQDLATQKADDNDPAVNEVIDKKLTDLGSEYDQIMAKYDEAINGLTEEEARDLFNIDDKIDEIRTRAEAIKNDPNLTDDAKKLLWQELKKEFEPLKQQRDAIQKQATSKVLVQPEAGTSQQVAEGESQAEPQGTTQETKVEKIGQALDADNTFTMRGKEGNLFVDDNGQVLFESGDEIVELGNIADVSESDIKDFGLEAKEPVAIEIGDDGSIQVAGKKYVNVAEDPMDAIAFDEDGNVKAVRLETENGLSRYFRGKRAESIAYQYTLQNFENNATDEQIDNAINQATEIATTEGPTEQVTAEGPTEVVEPTEEVVVEEGKQKAPPSAKKILGIKPKKVTVDEMASLKGQLRLQAKAAKTAYEFAEAARKLVATYIKNNVQGALSPADQKAIFRAMEGKLDTPANKKKMIDKITGILQKSEGKIAIKELDALGRMLKSMEKGSKLGAKAVADQIKSVVDTIKAMGVKNRLKPAQVRLLLNGMKKNLMNATVRDKFLASAQRVLNNAAYAEQVTEAQKLKGKLRKMLKTGKEIANVEQSVRNFLKLDPKMVEDMDEYMDYATEIFDAIRNVQVKDGKVLGKRAAVLANIDAYAAEQNAIQDDINKNYLLDEYNYLVEAGLISGDMSLDEIQSYIASIEENTESSESTKSDTIREFTKNAFEGFSNTVNEMIEDGEIEEQDVDFDMVKKFTEMDIEALPLDQQLAAVESLENFIVNGVTSRMGTILQGYTGVSNAVNDAKSGMKARPLSYGLIGRISYLKQLSNKGVLAGLLRGVASIGDAYNEIMATYISKADSLVAGVFRSTKLAMRFMKNSGFAGVVRGFVEGKKIVNDFAKKYSEKFDGSKPNGMDFKSALNIYERGIFADLSRTILNGTPEQIKKEFDRKMKQLELTIKTLRESGKQELIDKADLYDSIYQKIKDAKDINEVKKNVDPINQAAVKEVQDMWRKYYPEFRRMAADYYNVILEEDVDYAPDMYEKLSEEISDDLLSKGTFKMAFDVVSTEKTGTLQKNKRIEGLPKNSKTGNINRVRDYDFDFNNISALEKTLIDVRTTPYVQQFMGYTNSAAFTEIFPDMDERALILKRLNFNINALRERQDTYSSKLARKLNKFTTALSKYGTRIGLGSLSSAPKQSIPMVANTAINMINDLGSFGMGISDFFDKDAMAFLEKSGYGISLRGAESQTSIDFAEKLVDRANQGKLGNIQQALSYLGDKYIEKFLKNPDVFVANMAWLGYYRSKLKSMGVDMNTFDWKNHELNEEAADYAEFMVQDQQNMNVSELGGKLLASKDATTKIIRQLLFPFASYQFNLKDKNNRNLTLLTSKTSTNEEKVNAAKSYVAGLVESYTFQTIQGLIGSLLLAAAYSAIGYEEPEEEKAEGYLDYLTKAMPFLRSKSSSEKWNDSLFAGKSIFEFVTPLPLPGTLENYTLLGLNSLMDMVQGGSPKEQAKAKKELLKQQENISGFKPRRGKKLFGEPVVDKEKIKAEERLKEPFRFPVKEEQAVSQTVGDIVGGVPSVGIEAVWDMGVRAGEAFGDSYEDKYGNVYKYSDEQKKILQTSLIPRAMVAMNIAPREFLTISNNIVKAVNQKAKEDDKARKEKEKGGGF